MVSPCPQPDGGRRCGQLDHGQPATGPRMNAWKRFEGPLLVPLTVEDAPFSITYVVHTYKFAVDSNSPAITVTLARKGARHGAASTLTHCLCPRQDSFGLFDRCRRVRRRARTGFVLHAVLPI